MNSHEHMTTGGFSGSTNSGTFFPTPKFEMPPKEQMKIKLVPKYLVEEFVLARDDGRLWNSALWTSLGAVIGILVNWLTMAPVKITSLSIMAIVVFGIATLLFWRASHRYNSRAKGLSADLDKAGLIYPPD